jgi:hypothetical protein
MHAAELNTWVAALPPDAAREVRAAGRRARRQWRTRILATAELADLAPFALMPDAVRAAPRAAADAAIELAAICRALA